MQAFPLFVQDRMGVLVDLCPALSTSAQSGLFCEISSRTICEYRVAGVNGIPSGECLFDCFAFHASVKSGVLNTSSMNTPLVIQIAEIGFYANGDAMILISSRSTQNLEPSKINLSLGD